MLDNAYALLKHKKEMRKAAKTSVFGNDAMYGDYVPDLTQTDSFKNNTGLHPEQRKILYSNMPEINRSNLSVTNEEEA